MEIVVSDCLSELFRDAYRIHEFASRFRRQACDLQEISMNAAIASGHAGHQSKVFGEIAKQIGIVSASLHETIEEVHGHTGTMSNRMLDCIVRSGQREKFVQGLALLDSESGARTVTQVKADIDNEIWLLLDEVQRRLVLLQPQELRVRQLIDRVWSVVINVRIAAGEVDGGGESFFFSIAEGLQKTTTETTEIIEALRQTVRAMNARLETRCGCMKGVPHAA